MTDDLIALRSPARHEMAKALKPLGMAFGEEAIEAEFLSERPLMEPARFVNAFERDQRIGVAGAFTFRMTVPGGEGGASGITAVGVRPDHHDHLERSGRFPFCHRRQPGPIRWRDAWVQCDRSHRDR